MRAYLIGFIVGAPIWGMLGYVVACFMSIRQLAEADRERYGDWDEK